MTAEYIPVYIETICDGIENGAWMHQDGDISSRIIARACSSDLGILRLRVNDLNGASAILRGRGFAVKHRPGAVEVVPAGSQDFNIIAAMLQENGISVESTAIIPGIYQG
jgi:hypothetical protein